MNFKIGDTVLITTDDWFIAPDGESYKSVWGIVHAVVSDEEALGIKTNTNWYVNIGNMCVAGCQIHFAIKCDEPSSRPPTQEGFREGRCVNSKTDCSRIYKAVE